MEYTIRERSLTFLNKDTAQEHLKAQHDVTTISYDAADQSSLEFPRSEQYFQETVINQREKKRDIKEQSN